MATEIFEDSAILPKNGDVVFLSPTSTISIQNINKDTIRWSYDENKDPLLWSVLHSMKDIPQGVISADDIMALRAIINFEEEGSE